MRRTCCGRLQPQVQAAVHLEADLHPRRRSRRRFSLLDGCQARAALPATTPPALAEVHTRSTPWCFCISDCVRKSTRDTAAACNCEHKMYLQRPSLHSQPELGGCASAGDGAGRGLPSEAARWLLNAGGELAGDAGLLQESPSEYRRNCRVGSTGSRHEACLTT